MSDRGKEDDTDELKREYLPLVNHPSHPSRESDADREVPNQRVNNKSVLSAADREESGQKYSAVNLEGEDETFYKKNKKIIWIALGILLLIGVVLAIVLPLTLGKGGGGGDDPDNPVPQPDPWRYQEFNPYMSDPDNPPKVSTFGAEFNLKFVAPGPKSHIDQRSVKGVPASLRRFMRFEDEDMTPQAGAQDNKTLNGTNYRPMNPKYLANSEFNNWAQNLNIKVQMNSNNQAQVLIVDPNRDPDDTMRRRVNTNLFPRPALEIEARLQQVGFSYNATGSFAYNFSDIYTKETLVTTVFRKMIVTDYFSEVGLVVPSQRCFGLGQRNGRFQIDSGTYTFNARDREDSLPQDDGLGGKSSNHIHPFLLCQTEEKKDFFGIYFASTAPQVFEVVKFYNSTKMVVNYITIGGVLEFYVMVRGTAQEIIQRYHGLVGMPMMPPYYALGVFHGSNSYNSWKKVRDVYDNYNGALTGAKQALEGVFVEDFNQQSHWTFTVNPTTFPNLGAEVDKVHATNQRVIFGASLALAADSAFPLYAASDKAKCLIKSHMEMGTGALNGILANTQVTYLDTFNGCLDTILASAIPAFATNYAHGLDGLIVKDAHAPNQINGQIVAPAQEVEQHGRTLLGADPVPPIVTAINEEMVGFYAPYQINNDTRTPTSFSTYDLPFIPAFSYSGYLDNMSISLNATLGDNLGGGRYSTLFARNGQSGYGIKKTFNAVNATNQGKTRPLLFSDSSFSGSGQHSAALLTDLYRSWDDYNNVIGQAFALSMHGMSPMVDTCGSLGPLDEDLCGRWTQLATFMPMVRNYYNATYRDPATGARASTPGSEPWSAKTDQLKLAFASLGDRLKYSRYLYTQLYLTHTQGGSLVKPLFFDYPKDDKCFAADVQQSTFMLGDAIKVTPLLQSKQDGEQFKAYFPQGVWVNLYQPSRVIVAPAEGVLADMDIDSTQTNIHQKSGTVIPYLNNNQNLRTTRDVEQNLRTTFRVLRDPVSNSAEGHVMIDDGLSPNSFSPAYMDQWDSASFDKNFQHFIIRYSSDKSINVMLANGDAAYKAPANMQYQYLDAIEILNAEDLKDSDFACSVDKSWSPTQLSVFYTDSTKTLTIRPLAGNDMTFDQLMLVKFGYSKKDTSYCQGFSYSATIVDEGDADTYVRMALKANQPPGAVEDLIAEFRLLDDQGTVHIEITTESDYESDKKEIYRPPVEFYDITQLQKVKPTKKLDDFLQVDTKTFAYRLVNADKVEVFATDPLRLSVTDYFVLDSATFTPSARSNRAVLGLGERAGPGFLRNQKDDVHTLWPYDAPNPMDDGKPPGKNMYGYQPVYYYQAEAANPSWLAVFDASTYATDYFINSDIDGKKTTRLTKVAVGGIIDKIIIQTSKVEDAIKKYQLLTGKQTVAPLWAFGWNQCKFGYYDSAIWWAVYKNYTTFNLPLDTMWADIDYMDDYKVFTISQQSYADLPDKVKQIKDDGRYFVPIIDNAIAVRPGQGYTPYDEGMNSKVFVMKKDLSGPATGAVWPGQAYYPDFFKTDTVTWWQKNLAAFGLKVKYDGIWLDMNEPSSTCTGYCDQTDRPKDSVKYRIPYLPGQRDLEVQALGLDTVHTGLPDNAQGYRTERDVRTLYALKESQATHDYLSQNGKVRPFVLSRSNTPGIQKYAFSWLADNWSKQEWMETSIDQLYTYNLFGLPMMGSDICGFNLDASPELCTRWHQLGSFYPFARNHKNSVWKQTEPFQYNFTVPDLDDGRTYTDLIRTALLQRYSLLRYIYSSFHQIGNEGGAFFKPLFYDFQDDATTFDEGSTQRNIQLGSALKLSIQVQSFDQVSTEYQFPSARWCQIMPTVDPTKCWDTSAGASTLQRLDSGIADYQVHLRGGRIIPYQDAVALKVSKSADLVAAPTELVVLLNAENGPIEVAPKTYNALAAGLVYLDDGTSATDVGRYDIAVIKQGDGSYTVDFTTINDLKDKAKAGKASTISAIRFLWASGTGVDKLKAAKLTEASGAAIDLNAPAWDQATDSLRVELANTQPGKSWSFWDINFIKLS